MLRIIEKQHYNQIQRSNYQKGREKPLDHGIRRIGVSQVIAAHARPTLPTSRLVRSSSASIYPHSPILLLQLNLRAQSNEIGEEAGIALGDGVRVGDGQT